MPEQPPPDPCLRKKPAEVKLTTLKHDGHSPDNLTGWQFERPNACYDEAAFNVFDVCSDDVKL